MKLEEIKKSAGGHKARRRIGRGNSSGQGHTAGKGHKGAKSRSGVTIKLINEGGQMPMARRMPKRGFNNYRYEKKYDIINVCQLDVFDAGSEINVEAMTLKGMVRKGSKRVKLLAYGDLSKNINIVVNACSNSAREKIEKAGGSVKLV